MVWTVTLCVLIIHLLYWMVFNLMLRKKDEAKSILFEPPVSIVITVKNEENNLRPLLGFLRNQDYPEFEVIVVDDYSQDHTLEILSTYPDVRVIIPKENKPGKKHALEEGIRASKYDIILLTDGDCSSRSKSWIRHMINGFYDHDIAIGYSPLRHKGSIASQFGVYESWITGLLYLSFAKAGMPYMAVGRNLAFRKSVFIEAGGYKDHMEFISGDDDLFIQQVATGKNTNVVLHPGSFVFSDAPLSWEEFFNQKSRHISTSFQYQWTHKVLLSGFSGTQILFYSLIFISYLTALISIKEAFLFWLFKISIQMVLSFRPSRKLKQNDVWLTMITFDLALYIYYLIMIPALWMKKENNWKL